MVFSKVVSSADRDSPWSRSRRAVPGSASIAPASIAAATVAPSSPSPTATPVASPSATPVPFADLEWRAAAKMVQARTGFDAVVLGDGTVLAVGDDFACYPGPASSGSETAERYDPTGDAWAEAPSLNKPRKEPATVVLADGSALVVGGPQRRRPGVLEHEAVRPRAPGRGPMVH